MVDFTKEVRTDLQKAITLLKDSVSTEAGKQEEILKVILTQLNKITNDISYLKYESNNDLSPSKEAGENIAMEKQDVEEWLSTEGESRGESGENSDEKKKEEDIKHNKHSKDKMKREKTEKETANNRKVEDRTRENDKRPEKPIKNQCFTCDNCGTKLSSEWKREHHVNEKHVVDVCCR